MDIDTFKNMFKVSMGIKDEPKKIIKQRVSKNTKRCSNCKDVVPNDYGRDTYHDGFICQQCLNDGYGR